MSRRKVMTGDDGTEYQLGEPIGQGAFSTVYYCHCPRTGEDYAVKVYSRAALRADPNQMRVFTNEVTALRSIPRSRFIANKVAIYNSSRNCYILLDYAKNGTLLTRVVKSGTAGLPDYLVRRYFQQLVAGLSDVHRAGFAHRDIKPENLLLDADNDLRISDFGFATRCTDSTTLDEDCGTATYVAPEVLLRSYNGLRADIWSCGVTLFVMLTGRLPFCATRKEDLYRKIQQGVLPTVPGLCPAALHLLRCCLQVDPSRRLSLLQLSQHPYCRGYDAMILHPNTDEPLFGAIAQQRRVGFREQAESPIPTGSIVAPSASFSSLRDRSMRRVPIGELTAWRTAVGRKRECAKIWGVAAGTGKVSPAPIFETTAPVPAPVLKRIRSIADVDTNDAPLPSARSPSLRQTPLDRASSETALSSQGGRSPALTPGTPHTLQRSPAPPSRRSSAMQSPVPPPLPFSAARRMEEPRSILKRLGIVHIRMILRFALMVAQLLVAGVVRLLFNVRLERQVGFPRPVQRLLERFFEPPVAEGPARRAAGTGTNTPRPTTGAAGLSS